ncbi:hypothetical protein IT400_00705, partial [Candidatus Nomurabacteria bacterium]|nr:hypothetical protein [Candidatus Nomurabacteria bacterium]
MERFMPSKIENIPIPEERADPKSVPAEGYKKYWQKNNSKSKEEQDPRGEIKLNEKNGYSYLLNDFYKQLETKDIENNINSLDALYHEYELINKNIFMVETGEFRGINDSELKKNFEYKFLMSEYALINDLYNIIPQSNTLSDSPAVIPIVVDQIKDGLISLGNRYYEFLSSNDKLKYKIFDTKSNKKKGYDGFSHRYDFSHYREGFSKEESKNFLDNNQAVTPDFDKEIDELNICLFAYEKYFKINKEDLELSEWYFLHQYLKNHNLKSFSNASKIINSQENPKNLLRAFLSVEQGGKEMGDKILALGEKLSKELAEKVFAKYSELIDTANDTQKILEDILPLEITKVVGEEFTEIKESMLVRAKNLLVTFHENKEGGEAELLKNLERYKAGMLLYADTFKKLKQEGKEIKLETIKNTELNILTQEEKEKIANELWDITIANRPFIQGKEEIENRKNEFFKTIENKNSDFYVLKHGGSIVAFCSFTPDVNG